MGSWWDGRETSHPLAGEQRPIAESRGWARAWTIANPQTDPRLRKGVWYQVRSIREDGLVVLEVHGDLVAVPRKLLEFRDTAPGRFTVVYRGRKAVNPALGKPENVGRTYAVCPSCGTRVGLAGQPDQLECVQCHHIGEVAWWETG